MADDLILPPDESLAKMLAETIPKSLDDIIRLHRETSFLSMATDEAIMAMYARLNYRQTDKIMNEWRFIQLCVLGDSQTHLLGLNDREIPRITSPVREVDLDRGLVRTRSGTLYRLGYQAIGDPERETLISLCVLLNYWPVGRVLGVPKWQVVESEYFNSKGEK